MSSNEPGWLRACPLRQSDAQPLGLTFKLRGIGRSSVITNGGGGVWRQQLVPHVVAPLGEMSLLIRIRLRGRLAYGHDKYDQKADPDCGDDERDAD